MAAVRRDALGATVLDIGDEAEIADEGETFEPVEEAESRATFELVEDAGGEYRWRLRHRNGNVVVDSGQGYADRSGVHDAIESVKRNAPNADVEE